VVTRDYTGHMNASVRMAKSQLSALLDRAAAGEEIVITAAGRPKARLVGLGPVQAPDRVHRRLLAARPRAAGTPAEQSVRRDRDSRD
jgi:prevent-host-death family protein